MQFEDGPKFLDDGFSSKFIKDTSLLLQVSMQLQPVNPAECSSQGVMTTSFGEESILLLLLQSMKA